MGNGIGIAGMILGIIALIIVWFVSILGGVVLGFIGMILSIVGIVKSDKKAFGIVGLIFSLIAIIIGIIFIALIFIAFRQAIQQ